MRLLADMGVSMRTVLALRDARHDVVHLREQGLQRLSDSAILDKARAEDRVIVTFDLDFGDLLAFGPATSPSVILFRLSDETPASVNPRLARVVAECATQLVGGALVLVEGTRYRVRSLPFQKR